MAGDSTAGQGQATPAQENATQLTRPAAPRRMRGDHDDGRRTPEDPRRSEHEQPPGDAQAAPARAVVVEEPPARPTPLERLEMLCDPGSLQVIRSSVLSRRLGAKAAPGDGVVAGSGTVDGRPLFCYAGDQSHLGGSLGEAHADSIVRVMRLAGEARAPVVALIESAGARMQEGTAALGGYGRIFHQNVALSGRVPQISVITGVSAGGGSYSPALTDFVVMTRESSMFLTGPQIVREVMGEEIDHQGLGGPKVHERNGVCHFVTRDDKDAIELVRRLLGFLPSNAWEAPPRVEPRPPEPGDPGELMPASRRQVYDVTAVARRLVDGGDLLEFAPRWARNMVTALARIDGSTVGIVANQPRYLGGVIDYEAAQKAARFVRMCDSFGIPLVVLVDTPGFLPGTRQEAEGVIRHGAKLLHAFAESRVPRITVVLRQAYGGAYISMNAKDLGADFAFAWPDALIGIMGAPQAVSIIKRREIASAPDPTQARAELAEAYAAEHLSARAAAADGFIDEVVEPAQTRERLAGALRTLRHKSGRRGASGNIPL